jgi:hypothetical protein
MAYSRIKRNNPLMDGRDIVVTLPKGDRKHLQEKIDTVVEGYAWWDLRRKPREIALDSKIFVVCKNIIEGYFTIDKLVKEFADDKYQRPKDEYRDASGHLPEEIQLRIFFDEWKRVKNIRMKGFQGFKYRDFEYEEI